jgi:hypothetical protein
MVLIHTHLIASEPEPDRRVIQWVFRPVGVTTEPGSTEKALARAIADSVMYEADFEGDIIELRTRLFRPTAQPKVREVFQRVGSERSIRLRVSGGAVEASVKNMALPDILGTRIPEPVRGEDVHFASVYRMSSRAPKRNVPHPVGHCAPSTPGACETTPDFLHNGNPNCPPPKAAAFSAASAWDFELP